MPRFSLGLIHYNGIWLRSGLMSRNHIYHPPPEYAIDSMIKANPKISEVLADRAASNVYGNSNLLVNSANL
jgi:hypothetical protein